MRRLINSFNYAISGIIYCLKTQRNMRLHFVLAILVLLASVLFNVSRFELMILFLTISLVLIMEMINTALEKTVDMITQSYHPLAKIAKNVAAGAVLVAAINSLFVGYIVFYDKLESISWDTLHYVRKTPPHITFVAIACVLVSVVISKSFSKKGSYFQGGMPSGHAAIAACLGTAVYYLSGNTLVASLTLLLVLLVAQSRVEGDIHSWPEVIVGGVLGVLITLLLFQLGGY